MRWEALEDLERLTRDRGRLLAETENIGLLRAGDLEIVRVGKAGLREESWWRYGDEFAARRARARRAVRRGRIRDTLVVLAITGIPLWWHGNPERLIQTARHKRFGSWLWKGSATCSRCGRPQRPLWFGELQELRLERDGQGPVLHAPCFRCGGEDGSGYHLRGLTAEHVLRRGLAYRHFAGGSELLVREAMVEVERRRSTADVVLELADRRPALGGLPAPLSLALEIALNADIETRLLRAEVEELEARWREAEEIAAIADGELTPPPE